MENDKRNFCLSIAGHSFYVHTIYTEVYDLCKNYLTHEFPEMDIAIDQEDIEFERQEAVKHGAVQHSAYLETLAVYRKISETMLDFDTFLMHGAVIGIGNEAYMFTAKSGTGKTTHIRKWLDNLPDAYVVNGDKPLIHITDKEAIVCGTPWCGKEQMESNRMVPIKAIIIMERGEDNEIHEIPFGQAFTYLLQQTYMSRKADNLKKTLCLLTMLKGRVKFYHYTVNNMMEDAFEVSYRKIVRG